jgi:hypothetical protein
MKRRAPILLIALAAAAPLAADDVYLKNGRVFEDVIAEVDASMVRIQMAFGEMSFSLAAVERIEHGESSLVGFRARRTALGADPSAGASEWIELARWSLATGQSHAAREAALRAAEIDPLAEGLGELMRRLDFVLHEELGRWIPLEESMRLKGFEEVDGAWLSAEQVLARTAAQAAAVREREAAEERRLTNAVLALAVAEMAREPEPQVVYPSWPYGFYSTPIVWHSPPVHRPPAIHHPAPHGSQFAIPIEVRQPGSLFPVATNHGGFAGSGGG